MNFLKHNVKILFLFVAFAGFLDDSEAILCFSDQQCSDSILGSDETVADCCNSSPMGRDGGGYKLVSTDVCTSCIDFQTIPTSIVIESSPAEPQLDQGLSLNCTINTEKDIEINAEIIWLLPNGNMDSISVVFNSLTPIEFLFNLSSLEVNDFGTYVCLVQVSSDNYPGVNVLIEDTTTYTGTPTTPFSIIADNMSPTLGSTYGLTCIANVSSINVQGIEWLNHDGTLLASQNVSGGMDLIARELVFDSLSFSDSRRYICRVNSTISIPILLTVEAPEVSLVVSGDGPASFPVVGEMYTIQCNVTVPPLPDSKIIITWLSPFGDVLYEETIDDSTKASAIVEFGSFPSQTAGEEYTCEVSLSTSLSSQEFIFFSVLALNSEIDRCRGECDVNAICSVQLNTGVCMCNEGFTGNGSVCIEIMTTTLSPTEASTVPPTPPNEVSECFDDSDCDFNAECLLGLCECNPGFIGNGSVCTEIIAPPVTIPTSLSSCKSNADCDSNAVCQNNGICRCNKGFEESQQACQDVNECERDIDNCAKINYLGYPIRLAACINTNGGFQCQCRDGFEGDGFNCEDINECDYHPCHRDAKCENRPPPIKFVCTCRDKDAIGDGVNCCITQRILNAITAEKDVVQENYQQDQYPGCESIIHGVLP